MRKRVRLTNFPREEVLILWEIELKNKKLLNEAYILQVYLWDKRKVAYFLFEENRLRICTTDDDTSIEVAEWILEVIPKSYRRYFFNQLFRP